MIEDFIHETRFRLTTILDERRLLDGLIGLPACLALTLLAFMFLNSRAGGDRENLDRLEREAQTHLDKGQFVEARIAAMRMTQEGAQSQRAVLIEAKALRGMGREMDAVRLLSRVAPSDRPGHAAAHVMQAAILLTQKTPDVQAAHRHMSNALLSDPSNQDALELAARFAAGQRDWKTALLHLDKLDMEKRADLMLMKATALQFSGLDDEAVKFARKAEVALRVMQKSVISGAEQIRFSIAVSLSLQRQFEQAIQWMLSTSKSNLVKEERQVIAGIYLSWSRHLKEQPSADRLKVLELLEKGIQISPDSQDLIMAFLNDCDELPVSGEERHQHVARVLNGGGIATSFMHYYCGVQQWKQGDKEAARSHFELASSLNPGFSVISNNLAMAIASVSDNKDDLEKALTMMNELVKLEPENPFFLDTRGHVLVKLGKLKDAVRDLERSLPKTRNKGAAHTLLVELYQNLGMPELAAQHQSRLLADQISATRPALK